MLVIVGTDRLTELPMRKLAAKLGERFGSRTTAEKSLHLQTTYSSAFQMQRTPELRFFATVGREPEVEVALV